MFYLIEEHPNQKEFIVFKSDDLESAMERKLDMECRTHNEFYNYFITEVVRKDRLTYTRMLSEIKNEPKK